MWARFQALMALLAFVAGQLAAVPHAHGSSPDASRHGHDGRPHLHASWLVDMFGAVASQPVHSHSGSTHSHATPPAPEQSPTDPYESDAVYVASVVTIAKTSSGALTDLLLQPGLVCDGAQFAARQQLTLHRWQGHPPPERLPVDDDLYLTLRALRI